MQYGDTGRGGAGQQRLVMMVLTLVTTILTVACGSGGSGEKAVSSGSAGTQPATGEPYVVGFLTAASGPARDTYFAESEGFKLFVQELNARGGVNGHPIRIVVEDVGTDATKARDAAQRLVEQEKVIAILGLTTEATHPGVYDVARQSGIPVITGHSARPEMFPPAARNLFTVGNVFEMETDAHVVVTEKLLGAGKKVGCYVHEAPAGVAVCERRLEGFAKHTGIQPGTYVSAPIQTVDFGPFAERLIKDRPDAVWIITIAGHFTGMSTAVRRAGYDGIILAAIDATPEYVVKKVADQVGGKNLYGVTPYVSPDESGSEELERLKAAAKARGTETPPSSPMVLGWVLGLVMQEALTKCGYPCAPQQLVEILNNLTVDTKGLTGGPIVWTSQDHTGPRYWYAYKYNEKEKRFERVAGPIKFGPQDVFKPVK